MNETPGKKDGAVLSLVDDIPVMAWLAAPDKSITWLNESWFAFSGILLKDEQDTGWYKRIHPGDETICLNIFDLAFTAAKKFQFKCRMQDKEGVYQWMYIKGTPRFNANKDFAGFAGVCIEIQEEQHAIINLEKALAEKDLALEILRKELAEINSEHKRHNTGLESFTYIASHDLQEPLRKIQAFSKLILNKEAENFSAKATDYFSRIISAAERMQQLIDDLLSYSSTNVRDIFFKPTNLNAVLEEVLQNFQEIIEEKGVTMQVDELPTISAIHFQFIQVFNNIISNAIKFSKQDTPLIITIKATEVVAENINAVNEVKAGKYWHISIADNGIGFDQQYHSKIFELFQRLHGKNEYIGTGIGLAICEKIVNNHKGYIAAIGQPDLGATFNIYLPFIV